MFIREPLSKLVGKVIFIHISLDEITEILNLQEAPLVRHETAYSLLSQYSIKLTNRFADIIF